MIDWTELAATYTTDPATLAPDVLDRTDRADAKVAGNRAPDLEAPERITGRRSTPIGLADDVTPYRPAGRPTT